MMSLLINYMLSYIYVRMQLYRHTYLYKDVAPTWVVDVRGS